VGTHDFLLDLFYFTRGIRASIHQGSVRIGEFIAQFQQAGVKRAEVDSRATDHVLADLKALGAERLVEDLVAQLDEFSPDRHVFAGKVSLQELRSRHPHSSATVQVEKPIDSSSVDSYLRVGKPEVEAPLQYVPCLVVQVMNVKCRRPTASPVPDHE
jgi:hypothetical protein